MSLRCFNLIQKGFLRYERRNLVENSNFHTKICLLWMYLSEFSRILAKKRKIRLPETFPHLKNPPKVKLPRNTPSNLPKKFKTHFSIIQLRATQHLLPIHEFFNKKITYLIVCKNKFIFISHHISCQFM